MGDGTNHDAQSDLAQVPAGAAEGAGGAGRSPQDAPPPEQPDLPADAGTARDWEIPAPADDKPDDDGPAAEALEDAKRLHRARKLADAEVAYHRALELEPEHPDALHFMGLLKHQQGQTAAAVELLSKALALRPDSAAEETGSQPRNRGHKHSIAGFKTTC